MGKLPETAEWTGCRGGRGMPVLQGHMGMITHIPEECGGRPDTAAEGLLIVF